MTYDTNDALSNVYAVIMAGGVGTRLWPRSREATPKQTLHVIGDGTMIQNTVARLQPLVPHERILIVTNDAQADVLRPQIPAVPAENFITEPFGRNTAPCIGLAATAIERNDPEAIMIVLPADHHIENVQEFQERLNVAVDVAATTDGLVTLGITPTRPETGYGYIQASEDPKGLPDYFDKGVRRVRTFAEKPDRITAERFLESGDFLWNSGMFVWKTSTILGEFESRLPELYEELMKIEEAYGTDSYEDELERTYRRITPISIDYGVMEKAQDVYVLIGEFGWSDVGSWDETYRLARKDDEENYLLGNVVALDTERSLVYGSERMVATIGLEDVIVVDTGDAVLVCRRGDSQDVQKVVDYLRRKKITSFL